ncbi:LysM peptidoglycan-binding domain-containing protein [Micromonospora sp. WMMA1976]|uniref:LysM peptidoglycan-binding domain-containing protein n=1 Tax=Micromonospora sp. WMMA1976 TaxID=3014995 RepID=UPI00248C5EA4|nr:LysM peptidoglycan-binding domain-containing protein [Micromonospora sp. WMMA1976]WBC05304.1 LysM peptidoglycan-binding domain-containing protein [Micromonospora sp. WMMA1976]
MTLVGWAAVLLAAWTWVTFLVALVVETVAQLRGRRRGQVPRNAARIPGARFQQRAAAALIAAILGAVAAPALASAAAPAALTAPAVAAPRSDNAAANPAAPADAPTTIGYVEHPVERGESLLDIAEAYNMPWQRLAEANHGLAQPDGRSLQTGNTRVYAGWTLRIPVVASPVARTMQAPDRLVYEVARGDWLAGVAERFLGDADRYPELVAINADLERRDYRFPDHIERGWRITLPSGARDHGAGDHARGRIIAGSRTQPAPSAPGTGGEPAPGVPEAGDEPTAPRPPDRDGSEPVPPAPPAPARPSDTPMPTASASSPSTTASPSDDSGTADPARERGPAGEDSDSDAIVLGSLAGAGLLSALLLTAVLRRRRRQRQHRLPGRRLPHPRRGATERVLRVAEQPADVDRLDLALRGLAAALAEREQPVPDIVAAWIVDQAVTLVLTEPCPQPPVPWTEDGAQWTLPGDAVVPAVTEQLAPLPTLVAVGSQPGRHLLLDLERLGDLTIAGGRERTGALLRYLACELACNAWSDDVDVIVAGFPATETELLVALNPGRVRASSSVREAVARLRRRAAAVSAGLNASAAPDTLAGRLTDVGEAWAPQVLFVAEPDEDDLSVLHNLGEELRDAGRCAVAVVSSATAHADSGPNTVVLDEDGLLHLALPYLQVESAAAGLPVRELEPLVEIMAQARATTDEPTPPAAEPEEWAEGTDAAGALLDLLTGGEVSTPTNGTQASPPADPIVAIPRVEQTLANAAAPAREVTAAIRQRRRQTDPHLDADLRSWREHDPTLPRISVLGPVDVHAPGPVPDQRRRFHAELIVYLAQRGNRGASAEQLTDALWPDQQVKDASRRVAITRARRWLGESPDGTAWLPEMGSDRLYRLRTGYLLDWHLFRRLRSRGESRGAAGAKDLRAALELVRGAPLDGAERAYATGTRNPFTWLPESDIYPGHLTSAIVDTAHELAELYLDAGDPTGARWAVQQAWLADPERGDDGPWHDIMRAAHSEGHTAELRNLLGELMRVREAEVPEDLTPATYALLRELLPDLLTASTSSG